MNTTLLDQDVKRYVDAVAAALIDLPEAMLAEILEDLAAHLAEFDLANGPLDVQLGDPATYARELRASAGIAPPPPPPTAGSPQFGAQVRRVAETVRMHRWWRSTRAFLPSLEPAWWVARAWLLVVVMAGANPGDIPLPAPNGNGFVGLLLLAVLTPVSVRLGQGASRGHGRHLNRAASALGIILLLVFFSGIREREYVNNSFAYSQPPQLLRELPVMLFDTTGEVALGTRTTVTVDERGYMVDDETVIIDGLATPIAPCPNGRAYAACLRQEPFAVASTTTVVAVPSTTVVAAPSTTVAAPAAPTTSGG